MFIVPFTKIQNRNREKCNERQTINYEKIYDENSRKIAQNEKAQALVTGESIGQVASQTLEGLVVINAAVDMPVFDLNRNG